MTINRVVLVGRLTKDPELRYTPNGIAVARFTLACNRTFSSQSGEREADFINVVVWRKPAENAANFLHKGSLAGVEGRIQTGSFEGQDGKRVYTTEVVADSVQFLEPRRENDEQPNNGQRSNQGNGNQGAPNDQRQYAGAGAGNRQSGNGGNNHAPQNDFNYPPEFGDDDLPY